MSISYLFGYLWRKKWLIIVPTIVAVLIAWIIFHHEGKTYTSVAEISTGYVDINPLEGNKNRNKTVLFNNIMQALRSGQVLDRVTYKLLLNDLGGKIPFRSIDDTIALNRLIARYPGGRHALLTTLSNKMEAFQVLDLSNENDKIIRKIADLYGYSATSLYDNIVKIQRVQGTDFINITSTSEDSRLSAFVSNAVCSSFLAFYRGKYQQASSSSLDTLKQMVATKKKILDSKLKMLQGVNDPSIPNSVAMIGNLQSQLTEYKNNLIAAKVDLSNVSKQIKQLSKGEGGTNNGDIIVLRNLLDKLITQSVNDGTNDPVLSEKINKVRNKLQLLLSETGSNTGNSLSDLMKQKMNAEVKIKVAEKTIHDIQSKINALTGNVHSSASSQTVIQSIQNEIDVTRQEYINANKLYNEALKRYIFPGNSFKQTLVASPPLYADPAKIMMKTALVGFAVFFALIFIFIFLEFIDPSIKSPSYLKEHVPLPMLANLKRIDMKNPPVEGIFSANGSLHEYKKGFREQVKQLRYEVENSGKRVFLVAGYHTHSGKTTLIQSLAASLSLKKSNVLLIDANFHNNTLTRKYQAEPLLETLTFKGNERDNFNKITQVLTATENEYIKVIGCSSGDFTPDEALPKDNILTTLQVWGDHFDYVFIDCGALSKGPDCKELLKYVDSVIIVYAADQSLTNEDKKFVTFLKKEEISVLGTVLNKVNEYNLNT